jgi:hypothetical protein
MNNDALTPDERDFGAANAAEERDRFSMVVL